MALEDEEWEKADKFFEDALNLDAECAGAYIGKFLCSKKINSLDAVIKNEKQNLERVLNNSDDSVLTTITVLDEEEQNEYIEHVEEQINKYIMDSYLTEEMIQNAYKVDLKYKTKVAFIKNLKTTRIEMFKTNKIFSRAISYAKNEEVNIINKFINDIENVYDLEIKRQEDIENKEIGEKKEEIYRLCEETDKEIVELYNEKIELKNEEKNNILKKERNAKKIFIIIVACITILTIIYLIFGELIPKIKYNNAVRLYNEGKYVDAYVAFEKIGDYENSKEWLYLISDKIKDNKYNNIYEEAKKLFNDGKYEEAYDVFVKIVQYKDSIEWLSKIPIETQINNCELVKNVNSKDEIRSIILGFREWIVLDKQDEKALLMCRNNIDSMMYNEKGENITWEKCTLRNWLNNEFIDKYFTEDDRNIIVLTDVINDYNNEFGINGGNNTKDKIFLLSIEEAKKYFLLDDMRGADSAFWLRSPGTKQDDVAYVTRDGFIHDDGHYVGNITGGVRPAMWVKYK